MEIIKSHSVLKRDSSVKDALSVIIFIGGFLIIWQLFFSLELWPRVSLPSPLMVAESLIDLISDNTLLISTGVTLWRLLIGLVISILIGVGIGLIMVKFKQFGKTMSSFAVGLQSFPSIAWVPFAILLVGLNDFGILFVVVMTPCSLL